MSTPAIIYIIMISLNLGIALQQHGQPKTGRYSFVSTLIAALIMTGLLYWGGFFSGGHV